MNRRRDSVPTRTLSHAATHRMVKTSSAITRQAMALQAHYAPSLDLQDNLGRPRKRNLTLAQKMGLVARPPPPLSSSEWERAHQESQKRSDSFNPCAICHEPFHLHPQVLLSCSHVFHASCIASYERFSRSKQCPLCRRQEYQKRVITDGVYAAQIISATKIQACWRRYAAKKLYFHMLMDRDPAMKRAYQYGIMREVSDKYLAASEQRAQDIDRFLQSLDDARARAQLSVMTDREWLGAAQKAQTRGLNDCPICMQPLSTCLQSSGSLPDVKRSVLNAVLKKEVMLLSCSHCFHEHCIQSFEQFHLVHREMTTTTRMGSSSVTSNGGASLSGGGYSGVPSCSNEPRCPVCRAQYRKRPLSQVTGNEP